MCVGPSGRGDTKVSTSEKFRLSNETLQRFRIQKADSLREDSLEDKMVSSKFKRRVVLLALSWCPSVLSQSLILVVSDRGLPPTLWYSQFDCLERVRSYL